MIDLRRGWFLLRQLNDNPSSSDLFIVRKSFWWTYFEFVEGKNRDLIENIWQKWLFDSLLLFVPEVNSLLAWLVCDWGWENIFLMVQSTTKQVLILLLPMFERKGQEMIFEGAHFGWIFIELFWQFCLVDWLESVFRSFWWFFDLCE